VPEYYPWMHLDGYTPEEIKYSVTQMMLKNLTDNYESEILSTIENL
jgi:hypothetical protein